jgi:hypothetical protein
MNQSNKNTWVVFIFEALIAVNSIKAGIKPLSLNSPFDLLRSVKIDEHMPNQQPASTTIDPISSSADTCYATPKQTVTQWKYMYWFPCQLSWKGICFWPIRRRHTTYKVTLNEGIPLRDEHGQVIPVAKGKIRNWLVYDAKAWNALENNPVLKNRYPDYEPIASNEYVVEVETRYWLFNNVESTLRLCTEQP